MMLFIRSGNEYSAILRNGDVIKFENEREALAVQKEYDNVLEVLGKRLPEGDSRVTMKVCGENSEFGIRNSELRPHPDGTSWRRSLREGKAKKVRIRINTEAEYMGNSELGIRNSEFMVQKEKALA